MVAHSRRAGSASRPAHRSCRRPAGRRGRGCPRPVEHGGLHLLPAEPLLREGGAVPRRARAPAAVPGAPRPRSAASSRGRARAGQLPQPSTISTAGTGHGRRDVGRTGRRPSRSGGRRRGVPRRAARAPRRSSRAAAPVERPARVEVVHVQHRGAGAERRRRAGAANVVFPDPAGPSTQTSRVRAQPGRRRRAPAPPGRRGSRRSADGERSTSAPRRRRSTTSPRLASRRRWASVSVTAKIRIRRSYWSHGRDQVRCAASCQGVLPGCSGRRPRAVRRAGARGGR